MNTPTWGCPVSPDSLKHPCEFAVVEVLASLFSETALEAFGLRCFSNPKTNPARCFGCRRNFNPIDMVRVVKRTNLKDAVEYLTDTHVVEPERVQKLLALMAIAYCWCVSTGEWLNSIKPIKIKKGRKAISLFRQGLDELREVLLNISDRFEAFRRLAARFFEAAVPGRKCLNKVDLKHSRFLPCT